MSERIQLIVGLGNPGREYAHTRHNAGADFVAMVADEFRASWQEESTEHENKNKIRERN